MDVPIPMMRRLAMAFAGVVGVADASTAAETLDCYAFPEGDPTQVTVQQGRMARDFLATLLFDEHGLSAAVCDRSLYFVSKSGAFIRAFVFDNGPDLIVDSVSLARFVGEAGLIGYVTTDLSVAIPAQFDCAFAFDGDVARVTLTQNGRARSGRVTADGRVTLDPNVRNLCARKPGR